MHEVDGLRIVALDTSVPGYHHGELLTEQLAWLADVLATPAEHGTLLAMHHPPLPLPMIRAAELIELHDQHALADVVAGTDVRGILAGHLHFPTWSTFAGVPVSVAVGVLLHHPTRRRSTASSRASTPARASRWCTPTTTASCTPRCCSSAGTEVSHVGSDIAEALEGVPLEQARELASSKTSPFND